MNATWSALRTPARTAAPPAIEPLWLEWLTLLGLLGFATWLLGARGVWALLLRSDPTGITRAAAEHFWPA
jgi:hypothetical protein